MKEYAASEVACVLLENGSISMPMFSEVELIRIDGIRAVKFSGSRREWGDSYWVCTVPAYDLEHFAKTGEW